MQIQPDGEIAERNETELSVLNKRRKTNGIKWRKVAHGNPEVTGMWGKV